MGPVQTQPVARAVLTSAAAWINGRQAVVATFAHDGQITTCEINQGLAPEPSYLALVVRTIGDRARVVILGPSSARLALEREYVAIFHRPDRLLDVEPAGVIDVDQLIDRLRALPA